MYQISFFYAIHDINMKSVYGKTIHLFFDKEHFIKSGKLNHMLEQIPYDQLISKNETKIFKWESEKLENKNMQ